MGDLRSSLCGVAFRPQTAHTKFQDKMIYKYDLNKALENAEVRITTLRGRRYYGTILSFNEVFLQLMQAEGPLMLSWASIESISARVYDR